MFRLIANKYLHQRVNLERGLIWGQKKGFIVIISSPASPAGVRNPEFSPPKPLQTQKTAIFRPFLVFFGLEKASEGIWGADCGITGKVQVPRPRPDPFFSPRTRRAPRSICEAQSLLANLALFARGILRRGCPVRPRQSFDLMLYGLRRISAANQSPALRIPSFSRHSRIS